MEKTHNTIKILSIVPALNEEKNIAKVVRQLKEHPLKVDVLVVNDGSVDRTAEIARETGAIVVDMPFNVGIGGAVQTGFIFADRKNYNVALQFDGDGQHNVDEIEKIIRPILNNEADVVIGSRYKQNSGYNTPVMRRLGMIIFATVNSLIIRQRIADNTSGFRAYNKKAIRFLSKDYPSDYPEPEAVVLLGRSGFQLMEVPVSMSQREHGKSSINSLHSVYYMIKVLLAIFIDIFRYEVKREKM